MTRPTLTLTSPARRWKGFSKWWPRRRKTSEPIRSPARRICYRRFSVRRQNDSAGYGRRLVQGICARPVERGAGIVLLIRAHGDFALDKKSAHGKLVFNRTNVLITMNTFNRRKFLGKLSASGALLAASPWLSSI